MTKKMINEVQEYLTVVWRRQGLSNRKRGDAFEKTPT